MPIKDLNLSVRSYNCLMRERIRTVEELVTCSARDLLDIRNFGVGCLAEVKTKLRERGLSLEEDLVPLRT
jgi:DNA-directed RNA polymerase subunit alpha